MNSAKFEEMIKKLNPLWMFIKKIFFPEHHHKITISTQRIGIALLIGTPFLQWIIQTITIAGITSIFKLPLQPLLDNLEGGQQLGFWLVLASLIYSAAILLIQTWSTQTLDKDQKALAQNVLKGDRLLYREFLADFGSNGNLEYFICQHNFGTSWHSKNSSNLSKFCEKWSTPERAFHHPELNKLFSPIISEMDKLSQMLAQNAGPLLANADFHCIFDPSIHNDFEIEDHIDSSIKGANDIGKSICAARVEFINKAGDLFSTLPPMEMV